MPQSHPFNIGDKVESHELTIKDEYRFSDHIGTVVNVYYRGDHFDYDVNFPSIGEPSETWCLNGVTLQKVNR